uniref:Uncharacterized protein n=2 Tax=Hyaloperonospora arabidopsidis (strain Emoy2) TaxID=559515 RepID=M4BPH8_HYAAE
MASARTLATRDSSTFSHNSICRSSRTPGLPTLKNSRIHFHHSTMRLHYVPLLAAAALAASAHGRQAVVGAPEAGHQTVSPAMEKGAMGRHLRSHDDSDNRSYKPYNNNINGDYSSYTGNKNNDKVITNAFYNWEEDRSLFSDSKDTKKGNGEAEGESESSSVSSSDISSMMPPTGAPLAVPAKRRDRLDNSVKRLTESVADKKSADN